jgi:Protein of unknown function (DUF2889)
MYFQMSELQLQGLRGQRMVAQPERRELHHRQIDLRFFERSDALYEVEGRVLDRKSHPFRRVLHSDETPAGSALHDISVRLVIDQDLVVHEAHATMATTPFDACRDAVNTLKPLQGLKIGAGWNKRVRELLGGAACCTHIMELLGPMATAVYQGLAPQRLAQMRRQGEEASPAKINSCYAYAEQGEVVARLWPQRDHAAVDKGT